MNRVWREEKVKGLERRKGLGIGKKDCNMEGREGGIIDQREGREKGLERRMGKDWRDAGEKEFERRNGK